MHGDVRHLAGVDVAGGEHAIHLAVTGRGGGGEPRVAGQRQFDRGRGELPTHIGRGGLGGDAGEQRAGGFFGVGVGVVGAGQRPLQLSGFDGQRGLELASHQVGLGIDVQAGQHECHGVAEAADAVQRHLVGRRRRFADHAANAHSIRPVGRQFDAVHPGRHIRVGIPSARDLVEQLRGDGVDADQAAGAVVLGDHRRAVGSDLGQREAGVSEVAYLGEERVVAAGGLDSAFDHVPGHHGAGQSVVVGAAPAEVRGRRPDDHRGVGDPAGDHDVGAALEAVDDAPCAQVGVGRQWRPQPQFGRPWLQVVAFHVGDLRRNAQARGQRPHRVGQPGGVQATGVGDDAHPAVMGQAQAVLELGQEGLRVAAIGVFHAVATENQHGQLGQVVAGEIVQLAAGQHLAHGGEAVAVEARAVSDTHGTTVRAMRFLPWDRRRYQPTGRLALPCFATEIAS
ncbi:Uncharacterised protein [Mycobacterium tuberculosis]|uniref:Uncharacterized protein n=2 Tax=Mycobacterium tuberculosis TaxID=1773 RepID=A0A655A8E3_MYCTX|nr:Uncharacterised protein [Mycobacterium tuberculosis]